MDKILVSACLLGHAVRYNATAKDTGHPLLARWLAEGRLVPFCPEVAAGLPTPRPPAEIAGGRVIDAGGADLTAAFEAGARLAVETARAEGCRFAILTDGSPSCGSSRIYDGTFQGRTLPGQGRTTRALEAAGVRVVAETGIDDLAGFLAGSD
jgi:uncharacterized protein YbbK (DUF523 family)